MLKINMEYRKGILFVRLKGNLNANTAPRFEEYAIPIIKDYGIKERQIITCIGQCFKERMIY